jgi:hypothetical protein
MVALPTGVFFSYGRGWRFGLQFDEAAAAARVRCAAGLTGRLIDGDEANAPAIVVFAQSEAPTDQRFLGRQPEREERVNQYLVGVGFAVETRTGDRCRW